jgi:hypothetical protein
VKSPRTQQSTRFGQSIGFTTISDTESAQKSRHFVSSTASSPKRKKFVSENVKYISQKVHVGGLSFSRGNSHSTDHEEGSLLHASTLAMIPEHQRHRGSPSLFPPNLQQKRESMTIEE